MGHMKFDIAKLERLNDPGRLESLRPDMMLEALAVSGAVTIVDVGAGTGLFAAEFARRLPGSTIYAADMEPVMVAWMKEHRVEVAQGRVIPILSTETGVPLADGIADAVSMVNLHHELADPAATYTESLRLVRPGGRLLVVDWAARETPSGPPLAIRATAAQIEHLVSAAGFADIREHDGLPWHTVITATRPV